MQIRPHAPEQAMHQAVQAMPCRRPPHTHLADVVSPQVHKHHVLGTLLGICQQLLLQRDVLLRRLAAPPRAGERAVGDDALVVNPVVQCKCRRRGKQQSAQVMHGVEMRGLAAHIASHNNTVKAAHAAHTPSHKQQAA